MRPFLLEERRGRVANSKFTLFPHLKNWLKDTSIVNIGSQIEIKTNTGTRRVPTTMARKVSVTGKHIHIKINWARKCFQRNKQNFLNLFYNFPC
jgi:hypothetical protein